ncbi:MAG: histidine phosphatase family protein [Chloroflexi bacterium]|nr:histidine phosphatase family protein [Chloroflexota bacterium]
MPVIVLTRHGLTTRSDPEQHLGQRIDVGLSDLGRAQASALAERLAEVAFRRILTSPLRRARETAHAVAALGALRPAPEPDVRLIEMDYGDWEGLTYEQIETNDGERRRAWEVDPATTRCPGGESGDDVADRARSLLQELLGGPSDRAADERPILLVGHSTFNRILIAVALDLPLAQYRRRIVQGQVNLTALEWEPGAPPSAGKALLLNDLAHVRRPPAAPWN